jgi:hypothetical protein
MDTPKWVSMRPEVEIMSTLPPTTDRMDWISGKKKRTGFQIIDAIRILSALKPGNRRSHG